MIRSMLPDLGEGERGEGGAGKGRGGGEGGEGRGGGGEEEKEGRVRGGEEELVGKQCSSLSQVAPDLTTHEQFR